MPENTHDITRVLVVMPWGRVGSNLLMSYLNAMKAPKAANESLNRLRSAHEQLAWLDEFYFGPAPSPDCEIIASKQSIRAMVDVNAIENFVLENSIKVVRMFRRDSVRTAISQIRAKQYADQTENETGAAAWGVVKEARPLGPTEIDISVLEHRLNIIEQQNVRLEASFLASGPFDVIYEDFRYEIRGTCTRLSDYLNLPVAPFRTPFRKATPDNLASVISNFDEVKALLEKRGISLSAEEPIGPDSLSDTIEERRRIAPHRHPT